MLQGGPSFRYRSPVSLLLSASYNSRVEATSRGSLFSSFLTADQPTCELTISMMQASSLRSQCCRSISRGSLPAAAPHQLWQTHAGQRRAEVQRSATEDGPVGGEDMSDIMKQDMERFAARQQAAAAAASSNSSSSSGTSRQDDAAGGGGLKEVIDKVLIADFFLVLAILAWLGVGLVEKATVQSSNLVDAWLPLWPLVFQPAIGVLMAGALVSGGLNWLQEQQQKK